MRNEVRCLLGNAGRYLLLTTALTVLLYANAVYGRDTLSQLTATNVHLGIEGAAIEGTSAFSGQASISFPVEGLLRGAQLEIGGSAVFRDDFFHISIPLAFRYTFLTGSPFAPYLFLGTGYYVAREDETDHGFQLLHTGGGALYFLTESIAVGLGVDLHAIPISMRSEGPNYETTWFGYGLRLTVAL